MSSKAIIDAIKLAMSQSIRKIERDAVEANQLQNSDNSSNWNFALSSYKASYRSLSKNLLNISPVYPIVTPKRYSVLKHGSKVTINCTELIGNTPDHGNLNKNNTQIKNIDSQDAQSGKKEEEYKGVDYIAEEREEELNLEKEENEILSSSLVNSFFVNPLSGLTCIANGIPFSSVSVGMVNKDENGKFILENGVIYEIGKSVFYTFTRKNGSYVNLGYDVKIRTSLTKKLESATIFTITSPISPHELDSELKRSPSRKVFITKIMQLSLVVNSSISLPNIELGITYVAAGRCDIFAISGYVDIASCIISLGLAIESGAVLLNSKGEKIEIEDIEKAEDGFFVTNSKIVDSLKNFLDK